MQKEQEIEDEKDHSYKTIADDIKIAMQIALLFYGNRSTHNNTQRPRNRYRRKLIFSHNKGRQLQSPTTLT